MYKGFFEKGMIQPGGFIGLHQSRVEELLGEPDNVHLLGMPDPDEFDLDTDIDAVLADLDIGLELVYSGYGMSFHLDDPQSAQVDIVRDITAIYSM